MILVAAARLAFVQPDLEGAFPDPLFSRQDRYRFRLTTNFTAPKRRR
jgi:hypothetical protein